MAFTEATIFDADGRACAHSTGTFKYVRRLPIGPKTAEGQQLQQPPQLSTD
jgi:hypothetical protein